MSFFLSGAWVESLQKFSHSDAADFPFFSSYAYKKRVARDMDFFFLNGSN